MGSVSVIDQIVTAVEQNVKLRYEVTIEDLIASGLYRVERSRVGRLFQLSARWTLLVFWFGAGVILYPILTLLGATRDLLIVLAISTCLFGLISFLIFPFVMRRQVVSRYRLMYIRGELEGHIGLQELEFTGRELLRRSEIGECWLPFVTMSEVAADNKYTFVYSSETLPLVIPHDRVTDGDPEAFTAALKQKLA